MKRIFVCADGTWNRPEEDLEKDVPTNVLKLARAVSPVVHDGVQQVVFYDWGIGSYYGGLGAGAFGDGINKNIMDDYRFIVQNYDPGDELFFFGFSRGAYTVRSLAGLINNCGILRRPHAERIEEAFRIYKDRDIHPDDPFSKDYREEFATEEAVKIKFIGVWDTVGALGVPIHVLGFLNEKHIFHDNKIGPNIEVARHALALDELRDDFKPTIWKKQRSMDLKQVWFAGVHSDVGGGYKESVDGLLSDIPLAWMIREAEQSGARFEGHLNSSLTDNPLAEKNESHKGFFKILGTYQRPIARGTKIHTSVKDRYEQIPDYRPPKLEKLVGKKGWDGLTID